MENRLFLIDGHALIFKMYYAFLRRPMINSKGADMSVLFGFTKYILELIEREKPTHMAIAFDPPGKTFRHELYSEYKANRDATPQLVIDSLEPLTELCGAMNIPVLMEKGYEADDMIGTVSKLAEKEGFKVYMVTPDKDYGQLVSDMVLQYKQGKSGSNPEILDSKAICSKYGISDPLQVVEMLTICGDTSDNVPGVKGVGEVGAGKLISRYGTVDNIYLHIDELSPKQKEAFISARDHIGLSHELVTIRTDIPVNIDFADMVMDTEYSPQLADLFNKYEFDSLKRYIGKFANVKKDTSSVEVVKTGPEELTRLAMLTGKCSIIAESSSDSIFSVPEKVTAGVFHDGTNHVAEGSADDFAGLIGNEKIDKFGYDLKRQRNQLISGGHEMKGRLMDIELMHYLINPEKSHKLDILAKSYLGITMGGTDEKTGTPVQATLFDTVSEASGTRDRCAEAAVIMLLGPKIIEEMDNMSVTDLFMKMEEPLIRVLGRMERQGVRVDMSQLEKYAMSLSKELSDIQEDIREMADEPDLNIMSPKQIGALLFEKLKLDPKIKGKTGVKYAYPTDEETLLGLSGKHPVINRILEYRAVKKLLSTYIEPFHNFISPVTGKIHTTFNQSLTATGRLSSSKPNLQNIPIRTERGKEIRKAFVSERKDGLIISADYSQIELRIMAHLSCDKHLTEAFRHGLDVHAMTASKIFGTEIGEVTPEQRRIAKTANFGIMYGISAFGLAQRLRISRSDAKKIIDDYYANFPAISSYISDIIASAKEKGYVETLFGRRRYLPDITSHNATVRALAERNAINAPIQGTAADIIKLAMIRLDRKMSEAGVKSRMALQIHDELLFDAYQDEVDDLSHIIKQEMENVITLSIPLTVECNYGKNWLEAH